MVITSKTEISALNMDAGLLGNSVNQSGDSHSKSLFGSLLGDLQTGRESILVTRVSDQKLMTLETLEGTDSETLLKPIIHSLSTAPIDAESKNHPVLNWTDKELTDNNSEYLVSTEPVKREEDANSLLTWSETSVTDPMQFNNAAPGHDSIVKGIPETDTEFSILNSNVTTQVKDLQGQSDLDYDKTSNPILPQQLQNIAENEFVKKERLNLHVQFPVASDSESVEASIAGVKTVESENVQAQTIGIYALKNSRNPSFPLLSDHALSHSSDNFTASNSVREIPSFNINGKSIIDGGFTANEALISPSESSVSNHEFKAAQLSLSNASFVHQQSLNQQSVVSTNSFFATQNPSIADIVSNQVMHTGIKEVLGNPQELASSNQVLSDKIMQLDTLSIKQPGWTKNLSGNVAWMVNQEVGSARVNIKPAELGPMTIQISIQSDQLSVNLIAQQTITRDLLEISMPKLRDQFEALGFSEVDVNITDQDKSRHNGREQLGHNQEGTKGNRYYAQSDSNAGTTVAISDRVTTGSGLLDTFA